ncbi:hypothetical protein MXK52_09320 [Listeria innocua]|uniref:Lmo2079 family surface lipoprotein n=1 Tax=Listeria innocua TaxID=1642 RepID=UPI0001EBB990|nr:hypothetical protein [Listeria innocua]OET30443.1 hypothetical protein AJL15_12705 [Listeria monocytogenes]EFR93237.1 lipoprotein, putative [Listeria innocua FSL J1-023]MBC6137912.1 hypothetical protein [Listeria innocua]UVD65073.1 hypothetical protein MXK52_09320 [Listeria innocua]HAA0648972.1 hypothetical protein [Listeria innocua]
MKKGILFSILLALALVISACGGNSAAKTPQDKFVQTMKNATDVPDQSTYTTSFAVTDIDVASADSSAQTMGILKDIKLSMTTSTDKTAKKSETKLNLTSTNNLLPVSINLDFLLDSKTGNVFIPLKTIVQPDASLLSYLDQSTGGMWSQINTEYPDLKNKYLSTEELTSSLTGKSEAKTAANTKEMEAASKDLNKKTTKLIDSYFSGLEKDRFKEADDGTLTITLTNADLANMMNQVAKMMDDEKVKADFKVIVESQGSEAVTDFDTTYTEMQTSIKDAAKSLKDNKDTSIHIKVSVKPGKDNSLDTITLKTKIDDKSDANAEQSISFTVKTKAEKFVPIADFPTKDQLISSEELNKIITDVTMKMYGGMDLTGTDY